MRWMGVFSVLLTFLSGQAAARQDVIKGPDGKTIAVIYDCSSCKTKGGAECTGGSESGFHDGKVCGKCLVDANFGTRIGYANDLLISGYLKDAEGKPIAGRYVKLSLPNTWNYRTRTAADGLFRLMLGATLEREGELIRVELGDRTGRQGEASDYMLYMLPEDHKPCKE
jgi:hypothetical protein